MTVGVLLLQCGLRAFPSPILCGRSCSSCVEAFANVRSQYAQTMISELMPRGYDNMFFALFGITNRAVSIASPQHTLLC